MKRLLCLFVFCCLQSALSPAGACNINELQRLDMRNGFCSQSTGLASVRGCTRLLMRMQMADQFEQIALARQCGFKAEADKLEDFYNKTTPLVIRLYECVDDPISQADVEKAAHAEVDKKLAAEPAGCSAELKSDIQKRLPSLISADETSLRQIQAIADQLNLKK